MAVKDGFKQQVTLNTELVDLSARERNPEFMPSMS